MKFVEMENGQAWQQLISRGHGVHASGGGGGVAGDSDYETPSNQGETSSSSSRRILTKHLSLNGFPRCADPSSNGGNGAEDSPVVRYQKAKIIPSRVRKRVIFKNGSVNLSKEHVYKRSQRYLQDIFTTLVDIQWRWNLMVFSMGFILSWLVFAIIWWLIMFAHGDFDPHEGEWTPCIVEVTSFTSAFLFSLETQHTIGYGSRAITPECPEAVFILCMQSITGVMIQCFMAGIVFAKLSRPKKRSQTLLFSRNAVVCLRDGKLCLLFRVGDMRKSHIIGTSISAQIIRRKVTAEGEVIPYYHTQLDVRFDAGTDSILFIWPATIVHEINDTSPFYNMSAEDVLREKFEIVVILEGTIESTGQSIQARSSYLPSELLWGHRFEQLVRFQKDSSEYLVDYSKFNNTYEVETPLCSARDFYEYQRMLRSAPRMVTLGTPLAAMATDDRSQPGQQQQPLKRVSPEKFLNTAGHLIPLQLPKEL